MARTFRAIQAAFKTSCGAFPKNAIILDKLAKLEFFFCRKMRFQLVAHRMQLIAKDGRGWRGCVFEIEVVEFLELKRDVHNYLQLELDITESGR